MTCAIASLNLPFIVTISICWSRQSVCTFDDVVCFVNVSQERNTESPGNHFIAGHFPNDKGWRWNDESWNDMILPAELGAPMRKTASLCSAAVSVLSEPWNNDPSLFISVYAVNHNTSEMSLAFRRGQLTLCVPFLTSELSQGFIQIEAISCEVSPPLSWVSPLCPNDSSRTWPNQQQRLPRVHIHS